MHDQGPIRSSRRQARSCSREKNEARFPGKDARTLLLAADRQREAGVPLNSYRNGPSIFSIWIRLSNQQIRLAFVFESADLSESATGSRSLKAAEAVTGSQQVRDIDETSRIS